MKLSNNYKTVLYYGHILYVNRGASYLAADANGNIYSYTGEPTYKDGGLDWRGEGAFRIDTTVTFEQGESWKDTLIYCEGKGQEWMLDLKTKIVVEYARLQDGSILRQKALCNVMEALPFEKPFTLSQWEVFRKHSGVKAVASKDFLDALEEKIKQATPCFIEAEKRSRLGDDCLLIRVYYGAELIIPKWVQFIAMDSDGMVWGYEEQPEAGMDGEWTTGSRGKACNAGWRGKKTGKREWRDSLCEVWQ